MPNGSRVPCAMSVGVFNAFQCSVRSFSAGCPEGGRGDLARHSNILRFGRLGAGRRRSCLPTRPPIDFPPMMSGPLASSASIAATYSGLRVSARGSEVRPAGDPRTGPCSRIQSGRRGSGLIQPRLSHLPSSMRNLLGSRPRTPKGSSVVGLVKSVDQEHLSLGKEVTLGCSGSGEDTSSTKSRTLAMLPWRAAGRPVGSFDLDRSRPRNRFRFIVRLYRPGAVRRRNSVAPDDTKAVPRCAAGWSQHHRSNRVSAASSRK